ncbi:DUF1186 domain-containing protein [Methylobacterium aerolatum]|uniref:Zinc chelation protein SecC n=1 Tax=Methylobacterium aerolatum TaxID=418708 RepID=A0ABU0I1H3_9HYPH|nr:DUF1186 domain-containing protein [Methylobacterium aerolatum]MDQ0448440.1 hypothetical protein [Methylobacterium aerolatum]GJD34522.1 hypothetical protein FMGBMHLM_1424 [Methylobacterium aerolatum]
MDPIALLIEDLAAAVHLPAAALRKALEHPDAIADATLPVLDKAAGGADLSEAEANLLFWGLHVMAHARDARAYPPLLSLLRQDLDVVDGALGDAVTSTLPRILASVYDGETDPLFRLILDSSLEDAIRQAALSAAAFLCLDGRIPRDDLHRVLVRFDDAKAAVEKDLGWSAWEEAIAMLGFRDLAPRVEAAWQDGRMDPDYSDPQWFKDALREAERHPDDPERLPDDYGYLDDPVGDLDWTREGFGEPQRNPFKDVGRNDPCPCGSGKKFKKCCLNKVEAEAPWMPPVS